MRGYRLIGAVSIYTHMCQLSSQLAFYELKEVAN